MDFGICINSNRPRESDLCLEEMNNSANGTFVRNIHVDLKWAFNVLGRREKYHLHYPSASRIKRSRSYLFTFSGKKYTSFQCVPSEHKLGKWPRTCMNLSEYKEPCK